MSEISRIDEEEVSKLMELDDDELYEILGSQAFLLERPSELQFWEHFSKDEVIEWGKNFFDKCEDDLKANVCDIWGYCEKRKKYGGGASTLINVLIPTIGANFGFTGITMGIATVLSVLGVKYRLDKLCECDV